MAKKADLLKKWEELTGKSFDSSSVPTVKELEEMIAKEEKAIEAGKKKSGKQTKGKQKDIPKVVLTLKQANVLQTKLAQKGRRYRFLDRKLAAAQKEQ